MDNKQIEERKVEIEKEYNKLQEEKIGLLGQRQTLDAALKLINEAQIKLQGSYSEVCKILGLDPTDEKNLSIQVNPKTEEKAAKEK